MKHTTFPIKPVGSGRGKAARARVSIRCELRQGMAALELARVIEMSSTGFRIVWRGDVNPGIPLRIKLPGMALMSGRVAWVEGLHVGVELTSPLHDAVFEHLVRSYPA